MTDLVDEVPRDRIAGTSDLAEAWSPLETRPEPRTTGEPGHLVAGGAAGRGRDHPPRDGAGALGRVHGGRRPVPGGRVGASSPWRC